AANRGSAVAPRHLDAIGPVAEVRQVELEPAARLEVDQGFDLTHVTRFAVRREAHDLEFVAVVREAEILREREIQQPERVRKVHALADMEAGALDLSPRRADEIAEAVNRAHGRIVERADECG